MVLNRILQIAILILFSCATSIAQKPGLTELTYLKNGGIIRGAIVELIPNDVVKIKTTDGSVVVYSMDDVEKVLRETNQNTTMDDLSGDENVTTSENNKKPKESNHFVATEIVFGFGIGNIKRKNSSLELSNISNLYGGRCSLGFYLGKNMIAGLAVGIEGGNIDVAYLPLYVDFRFPFGNKKTKISLNMASGMAYYAGEPVYILNPSLGIRRFVTEKKSFNFSIGTYSRSMLLYNENLNIVEDIDKYYYDIYGNVIGFNNNFETNKTYRYFLTNLLVSVGFSF
jgi:hypothetical protein